MLEREIYVEFFQSVVGKRVLEDLKETYLLPLSYSKDPYQTAFNEGKRAMIKVIMDRSDPKAEDMYEEER